MRGSLKIIHYTILISLIVGLGVPTPSGAQVFYPLKATLSQNATNAPFNISLQFTATATVPPLGTMTIHFDPGFSFPMALNFQDMDIIVNGTHKVLTSVPGSALSYAVTIAAPTVSIALGSATSIAPADVVEVILGNHATFGGNGVNQIRTPSVGATYGYPISVLLKNTNGATLAYHNTSLHIRPSTGMSATVLPASSGGGGYYIPPAAAPKKQETTPAPLIIPPVHPLIGLPPPELPPGNSSIRSLFRSVDISKDGLINHEDVFLIIAIWLQGAYYEYVDINRDNKVSLQDISIVLSQWRP